MESVLSSESPMCFFRTIWPYIQEDSTPQETILFSCLSNYTDFNLSIYYKDSSDVSSLPVFFLECDCICAVWEEGLMGLEWNGEFEGTRRETFDTDGGGNTGFADFYFLRYITY
jgi:hypothetical protein